MKNIFRFLLGRFIWTQYSNKLKYKGGWKKGYFHGKGILKYSNGSIYSGSFFEGSKNGNGQFVSSDGYEYVGDWVGGKQTGRAQVSYKNGDLYTGRVKDGLRQGYGQLFQLSSNRNYSGYWNKGALVEEIAITDPNWTFEGLIDITNGNGSGSFTYKDGSKYFGEIANYKRHGKGTLEFKSGEIISGIWSGNVNVQSASIIDNLGFQWSGDLQNMQPDGFMTVKKPNGIIYDSVWEQGAMVQSLSVDVSHRRVH